MPAWWKFSWFVLIADSYIFTLIIKSFSGRNHHESLSVLSLLLGCSFEIFALRSFKRYFFNMQLRVAKHRVQKTFSKSFASRLLLAQKKLIKNLPLSLWAQFEGKRKSTCTVNLRILISKKIICEASVMSWFTFSLIIKHMSTYNYLLWSVVLRQRHWHVRRLLFVIS